MRKPILFFIKRLKRPIFTTSEVSLISGKSLSATVQALNVLEQQGLIFKVYRGVWAEVGSKDISPYKVVPYLFLKQRVYVSFISALHLHGMIEQIPQVVTIASTGHTKVIHTNLGVFSLHRIAADFFSGFNWYQDRGDFLIAEPEKALVDSLYISSCKKKQFGYFPELHFSKNFSFSKLKKWVKKIPSVRSRSYVEKKVELLLKNN